MATTTSPLSLRNPEQSDSLSQSSSHLSVRYYMSLDDRSISSSHLSVRDHNEPESGSIGSGYLSVRNSDPQGDEQSDSIIFTRKQNSQKSFTVLRRHLSLTELPHGFSQRPGYMCLLLLCRNCLMNDCYKEAHGFCLDCKQDLCKSCIHYHPLVNSRKNHRLINKPNNASSWGTLQHAKANFYSEQCAIHPYESIKYFCNQHMLLGCSDCMYFDHKNCNVEDISDKTVELGTGEEFESTIQAVAESLNESEMLLKAAESIKENNTLSLDKAIEQLEQFQKKVYERLKELKRQMIQEAKKQMTRKEYSVDQFIATSAQLSSELNKLLVLMQKCKTESLDKQLFLRMKQAQQKLKILNKTNNEIDLEKQKLVCEFVGSSNLMKCLSATYSLGTIHVYLQDSLEQIQKVKSLALIDNINVRTEPENVHLREGLKQDINISSCAVLSQDTIIIAECEQKKLKVLNMSSKVLLQEENLKSYPFEIAVLPQNNVAVTLPQKEEVLIVKTAGKLSVIHTIQVKQSCYGICYHKDLLYIVCQRPHGVNIFDMQGNPQSNFSLTTALNETVESPSYITLSKDLKHMYVSDSLRDFIVRVTINGEVTKVYKHEELRNPAGLAVLDDGSLLVCCTDSSTIHEVSADLNHGRTLIRDIFRAKFICYRRSYQEIIVGSGVCDFIKVFRIDEAYLV